MEFLSVEMNQFLIISLAILEYKLARCLVRRIRIVNRK